MSTGSSKLIQASAGTGKTYALSGQFISLLLRGEDCSTILASTFTRKAAGEILERIYLRLAKAVREPEAKKELARQSNLENLSDSQIQSALLSLIENQHQLKVSTLDSFASSVARLFSEELGLPSKWNVQDQPSASMQLSTAVAAVCSSLKSEEVASLVTTLRRGESSRSVSNAIRNIVGGLLGVFQESEFSAWDWLKIKNPNPAAKKELLEVLRTAQLPTTKAGKVNQKVYSGFQKLIEFIEKEDWSTCLEGTLLQNISKGVNKYNGADLSDELAESLKKVATIASQHGLARLGDANRAAYGLLLAVIIELQMAEDTSGKISFDRIIRRLVQLGRSLFSDELYYRLDTKIHHVLLDEFQDTSLLQWQLLEPLIDEKLSSDQLTSSFFCVGDGKQAIYGWREGNTAIFDSIPKRWPHIELNSLEKSYRSSPVIIKTVNTVFNSLNENPALQELQPAVSNWLKRFRDHSTVVTEELSAKSKDSVCFEAINADSDSEIYSSVIFKKLNELVASNPEAEIGILVRDNKAISHILDLAQSYNFELSAQGGTPLTRFPLITAILALLSLIDNPGNSIKRFEASASPWCQTFDLDTLLNRAKINLQNFGLAQTIQSLCGEFSALYSSSEKKALEQLISLAVREELANSPVNLPSFINLVEGSAVEDLRSTKVQVLTIHKSKGLEFDIVVVPDLSWDMKPVDKHNFLLEREALSLKPVKVSLPDKKSLRNFSLELTAMAQQKYQSDFEESLSLLYVALTRAKSQMHLITPQSGLNGISAASLIAFRFAPNEVALVEPFVIEPKESKTDNNPALVSGKTFRINKSTIKQRGLGRISPSSFIDHELTITDNDGAELFGTRIHKLFSITKWKEDCLDENELIKYLTTSGANLEQAQQAVSKFIFYLSLEQVAATLKKPNELQLKTTEIYTEKSFIFRKENALIQGRIDRLVVGAQSGSIIDFKVGKTPEVGSQRLAGYIKQLEIYKEAAGILFPNINFQAALLFLGDGNKLSF